VLEIGDKLISLDIIDKEFACDLEKCKGNCCVYGDSGAPLEAEEIKIIEENYEIIKPYMTERGIEEIEKQGFSIIDKDHDTVTPLIDNLACAYISYKGDIALCAIERAFLDKKLDFQKPISCHLYPIRITKYSKFTAVNYDKWDICKSALKKGKQEKSYLYKYLETPIKRKFGNDFFSQLKYAAEHLNTKDL
jgi:hypothetical protein